MRHFLLAGVVLAAFGGPAFAGSPTPPTPPNVAPVNITVQTNNAATGGGNVNVNVHTGPITVAESVSFKATVGLSTSQSISNGGYSVP